MNQIDENYQRLEQWESRIHPPYNEFERYEGASRCVTLFDGICSSKQLRKKDKHYKFKTREEIAALTERNYIVLG